MHPTIARCCPRGELGSTGRTSEKKVISMPVFDLSLNYPISNSSVRTCVDMCPVRPMMCFRAGRDNRIRPVWDETSPALHNCVLVMKDPGRSPRKWHRMSPERTHLLFPPLWILPGQFKCPFFQEACSDCPQQSWAPKLYQRQYFELLGCKCTPPSDRERLEGRTVS